eukprot:TRINITY_DN11152_c0_g1_i1.p1 TRINITY_DN11152_c0_g1~~TRINITY_DN11152_c0_g1_i1.p1  ORF type:complete len:163 (+),score=48.42 TRINITY_DN11152_c0_g1_i1:3-491(+)
MMKKKNKCRNAQRDRKKEKKKKKKKKKKDMEARPEEYHGAVPVDSGVSAFSQEGEERDPTLEPRSPGPADKELAELIALRDEMRRKRDDLNIRIAAAEKKQEKNRKIVIGNKPANLQVGELWVSLITDMLCKQCPSDITSEQLGQRLAAEVKDLVLQCPVGS